MSNELNENQKIALKMELQAIYTRGYTEGCKDTKESMLNTLKQFKIIQGNKPISINDMIDLVEKIK